MQKIIFYDGDCPLCNRSIRFLLKADKKKLFKFAPLGGKTAAEKLAGLRLRNPDLDTLVLLENDHLLIEGKGALRILWLLGGRYALIGWLSFLPAFLFDSFYRLIARYRYRLFSGKLPIDETIMKERFLP